MKRLVPGMVPCPNGAAPALLQMKKKHPHQVSRYVYHIQGIDALAGLTSDERDEQSKGVSIALLCARDRLCSLIMFEEESASPAPSHGVSHGDLPEDVFGKVFARLV